MRKFPLLITTLAFTAWRAFGQTPVPPAPAEPRPEVKVRSEAPAGSPEILSDRRVTFSIRAPQAQKVTVAGQWPNGNQELTKGDGGLWSATVGPLPAGIWEYSFNVDGVQMIDPSNLAIKPQRQPRTSILQVRGEPPALWDFQEVPHGTLHRHSWKSPSLGEVRSYMVYTPPGYERDLSAKYPVLYLIHGFGDSFETWSAHGKANWILDNLQAQGKAKPMIVVMPDGHPLAPGAGAREEYGRRNTEAFEQELTSEILPQVESLYRARPEREARAIAGLSMGGGHSLNTGLRHLDQFAWIGAFSAATPGAELVQNTLSDSAKVNAQLSLLWIACGRDDRLVERNRSFVAQLTEKGIHHTWCETDGAHSWPVWRNYLTQFAPLLFQGPSERVAAAFAQ